jgi:hypothetical protein
VKQQPAVPPSRSGTQYGSYLLRLRWFEQDGQRQCQYMLHNPRSGEQRFFADLDSLAGFLRQMAGLVQKEKQDSESVSERDGERASERLSE